MAHRHPVTFHVGDTEGGRVQQQVDEMVVQEVDLVDVEQAAMGGGEQPRPQRGDAFGERPVEVDRSGDPVLRGADRQLHQARRPGARPRLRWMRAVRAVGVNRGRVTGEPAAGYHVHRWEQRGEPSDRGRLGRALLAADEDPADRRGHRVEDEREPQVVHAHHRGQRVGRHRALCRCAPDSVSITSRPITSRRACVGIPRSSLGFPRPR